MMTDSEELEHLRKDLKLVADTAKVLASKLEKVFTRFEQIFSAIEGVSIPQSTIEEVPETPPVSSSIPSPTPSEQVVSSGGSGKTGRLLDSFLGQVQTISNGAEISDALSRLRDQVMQSAEVGFHPAFHEMGRYANQIKNIREISSVDKEQLIEKIYDWKTRLAG